MIFLIKKERFFKSIFFLIITFLFSSFFIFPSEASASYKEEKITVTEKDANLILHSLVNQIIEERINSFVSDNSNPEKGAILVLLEKITKTNSVNYLMRQAPKEILIDFLKAGVKIVSTLLDPSLSNFIEMTLEEAKEYVVEWIFRNNLRIGGGNLSASYNSYEEESKNVNMLYILTHNPLSKKIEVKIYSKERLKPPKSTGSFTSYSTQGGGFWDEQSWVKEDKNYIEPFTIEISGKIKKNQYDGYSWESNPLINVDFVSKIPDFELKKITFWDKIKSNIFSIAELGSASLSSFTNLFNEKTTVIDLENKKSNTENNLEDKKESENKELIAKTSELENELKKYQKNNTKTETLNQIKKEEVKIKKININIANEKELTLIIHIGPAKAKEIIKKRPFYSLDDLIRVSGIGEKIISDIKKQGLAYVDELVDNNNLENLEEENIDNSKEEIEEKVEEKVEEDSDNKKKDKNKIDFCKKQVNINTAPINELTLIIGVGPVTAQRIIEARPFSSIDDLLRVSGIGPTTLNNIKKQDCAFVDSYLYQKNNYQSFSFESPISITKNDANENTCVDINNGTKDNLERLTGVGPVTAQKIIEARPFSSIDDLLRVSGIGPTTLNNIKNQGIFCSINPNKNDETEEEKNEDKEQGNDEDDNGNNNDNIYEIRIVGAESLWTTKIEIELNYSNNYEYVQIKKIIIFNAENKKSFNIIIEPIENKDNPPKLTNIFIFKNSSDKKIKIINSAYLNEKQKNYFSNIILYRRLSNC